MAKKNDAVKKQSDAPIELVSVNAFAKFVGVDEKSIRNHILNGHFPKGVVYDDANRKKMDKAKALAEWKAFGGGISKRTRYGVQPPGDDDDTQGDDRGGAAGGTAAERRAAKYLEDANKSKAKAEHYRAQILELEFKELEKSLVRREDVYKEIFAKGADLRAALLRIPGIVIDKIMTCTDRTTNINLLIEAIENELTRLTDEEITDDDEDE